MPSGQMVERLALRKDESISFVVPRFELSRFPVRFTERYPEMVDWKNENQAKFEEWRGKLESNLKEQLGALKSGK